jgi:hypothetical protein
MLSRTVFSEVLDESKRRVGTIFRIAYEQAAIQGC